MKRKALPFLALIICHLAGAVSCKGAPPETATPAEYTEAMDCVPYGVIWPTAVNRSDPPLGKEATATPETFSTPTSRPRPTCTPRWPTWTPRPTLTPDASVGPPIKVATAPQNITLSPGSEKLDSVAVSPNAIAVTWQEGGRNKVGLKTAFGWREIDAPEGVEGALALDVSPGGRFHLLSAGGQYVYSEDDGFTWSEPVTVLPSGGAPRVVTRPDRFAQAFTLVEGTLYTGIQQLDSWSPPESLAGGVVSYDVAMDGDHQLIVVTGGGGTRLYRDGELVNSWPGADFASVLARDGRIGVGMGQAYQARIAWTTADGSWHDCRIQEITALDQAEIGQVYAIPAWRQRQMVALWNWEQPSHDGRGKFPYIIISYTGEDRCDPFPAVDDAQLLYLQFGGPPGLFKTTTPQDKFYLSLRGRQGAIAFEGLQWNGGRDVYVAEFNPDSLLSAPFIEVGQ